MPSEKEYKEYDPDVHLCYHNIKVDSHQNPTYPQVTLKASKMDPFRQGVTLYVGATQSNVSPVAAVLSFYGSQRRYTRAALQRKGWEISHQGKFVAEVQSALRKAGYPTQQRNMWGTASELGVPQRQENAVSKTP